VLSTGDKLNKNMIEKILKELGIPENAASIYLRLIDGGPQTARKLAENLNLPRPTVYDNLKTLINKGLVTEIEEENKKIFSIDDLKNLPELLRSKIADLKKEEQNLKKILPKLSEAKSIEPKIKLFVGPEGIKRVLTDIIWRENIKTLTMWPISDMMDILGKDYMEELNRRRIRHNISIRGIWPRDKAINFKDYPFMGVGKGFLRFLRWAPKGPLFHQKKSCLAL
jgi:sugar-specific transcriptional regulator TrmB